METNPPRLIMLCGIPTSGKSSYVRQGQDETPYLDGFTVLSTDAIIERRALENNISYNDAFGVFYKDAEQRMYLDLQLALLDKRDIVWDQTNLTPKARRRKLAKIPSQYKKTAVWFDISLEEAMIRNQQRPGKVIPGSELKRMHGLFVRPTIAEGFDLIIQGN
ncbi:MAG: ATP-binding protein [Proteobacteria bacterium]|nr:ATP-binding protein [Pseudomonadota bacterium]NBT19901.1 ATP-binding protein [Pseudomonadota bacterium]